METFESAFESGISTNQELTFKYAKKKFASKNLPFGKKSKRELGLVNDKKKFTNLGLLLSDQCPSSIKAASFSDDDRNVFLERQEFAGSILKQLDDAYAFLTTHNHYETSYEGLERVDFYDYPAVALREALINAIAHRDYTFEGPTLVSVMPSRVEFTSLGGLPAGLTSEDLDARISLPRNKRLAASLSKLEIIETYGTGMARMRAAYDNQPDTVGINVTPHTFTVILANRNANRAAAAPETKEPVVLTNTGKRIVEAVANGAVKRKSIQETLGLSQTSTIRELGKLLDAGVILKEGSGKNTIYRIP